MAILFVADQLAVGGAERHLVALATGLAASGHHVAVAYLKPSHELAAALSEGGVAPVLCCGARGGIDFSALHRLGSLIELLRPDLLVGTTQYALMYAALARRRCRSAAALAFICHSMGMVRRGLRARLRFTIYRRLYRHADCVIFLCERQRAFFAGLGIAPRRAEVVYNGVDLRRFTATDVAGQAAILRARYGLSRQDLVIGLCAVFREEKRHTDLLAAVARLRAMGIPARALLVGDGALRPAIEACRDALGLRDAVLLAGARRDVRPYIAVCDVMALTSDDENFPLATLECMALGKPVVASAVGGIPEQVEHGVNGLLYRAGHIDALADALACCADPALRARLGQGALDRVRARFDVQQMVARYDAVFRSLRAPAPPRRPEG